MGSQRVRLNSRLASSVYAQVVKVAKVSRHHRNALTVSAVRYPTRIVRLGDSGTRLPLQWLCLRASLRNNIPLSSIEHFLQQCVRLFQERWCVHRKDRHPSGFPRQTPAQYASVGLDKKAPLHRDQSTSALLLTRPMRLPPMPPGRAFSTRSIPFQDGISVLPVKMPSECSGVWTLPRNRLTSL